jgi:hypothetical protein
MKCSNCGHDVSDGAKFCTRCGFKLDSSSQEEGNSNLNPPIELSPTNYGTDVQTGRGFVWKDQYTYIAIIAAIVLAAIIGLVVKYVKANNQPSTSITREAAMNDSDKDDGAGEDDGDYYDTETETGDEEDDYVNDDYDDDEDDDDDYLDEEDEEDWESEYIFPYSDSEYLTEDDLEGLSAWQLRIGRNEIMARHGRRFNDESLQEYFDSCSWYEGTREPEEFDSQYDSLLNKYEKKNASLIKEYENR